MEWSVLSLGVNLIEAKLSSLQVELHSLQDGVRLLVIVNPSVQLRQLRVILPNLSDVADAPEHQDAVAEEEPAEGSWWALEQLTEVERMGSTWSRHHVNEE